MKWGMEILAPYSNWILEDSKSSKWTQQENKLFENALAIYDKDMPDRWQKVANMIPGKTVMDVFNQYKELENDVSDIEAGLIPLPGYTTSSFSLEWMNEHDDYDGLKQSCGPGIKRTRPSDHERKKGVPWTEEEHKLFLLGLKKYGKGDWRNISRKFVITRTPTQVASHAQKYFIRQHSGGKDKRRSSIHDITTVNCIEGSPLPDNNNPSSPDHSMLSQQPTGGYPAKTHFGWNQPHNRGNMIFRSKHGDLITPPTYGITSNEMKLQGHNLQGVTIHGSQVIPQRTAIQMHSSQCHPH
ncbi:hypothetical protein AQUCO_00400289v1 [Aquilegia coerulea]|uniref:Uncharacterized protein n=1 Tax=Aquilegia coerulea TaxID=218851 RepID=A0A2G5EUG5_AQUCA|nr:hypothetical protein AQUCO_00400289v1 [Aquilegia coerulea]PIA59288.1 hypothetical protein AQUCO_00400289v1 [Aquilegia coerulea]PIA59289.1 hypothetical protein AQUCO_00400289v1 [Aquilegia coerulea]